MAVESSEALRVEEERKKGVGIWQRESALEKRGRTAFSIHGVASSSRFLHPGIRRTSGRLGCSCSEGKGICIMQMPRVLAQEMSRQ